MERKKFAVSDVLAGKDIRNIRKMLGLTQAEFADFVNVSVKTIERWEAGAKPVTGPIVTLLKLVKEKPQMVESLKIPEKNGGLRLWYMWKNEVCTIIDVDEERKAVKIYNYTSNFIFRAFGNEEHPDYGRYEEFLESRCFPRTRDKMKLVLQDLDLPFYDPMLIIEKTQGRMAEDDFWIQIER